MTGQPRAALLLAPIIACGALLRLQAIQQPFTDAISWRQSSVAMIAENFTRNGWNIFYPEVSWSGPGPSYQGREFQTVSYLAALLYQIVGQHAWVGRGVAVAFGVWGLFALCQLVVRLWDPAHALAATAVMAVLPGSIYVDRSFIPDPAMVALMLTSFWLLLAYAQTDRRGFLVLAVLTGAWGALTKITGLVLVPPMLYAALSILRARGKLRSRQTTLLLLGGSLGLVPVVGYYLWAAYLSATYPPYHFAGGEHWIWNDQLAVWLQERYFLAALPQLIRTWLWTWPGALLAALGLLLIRPAVPGRAPAAPWVLHVWLLASALFYLVGAEELIGQPWNFHIISPLIAILAGHTLVLIARVTGRFLPPIVCLPAAIRDSAPGLAVAALLLAGLTWAGQTQIGWLRYPYAQRSYELGTALAALSRPTDLVVTIADDIGDPTAIYYSQRHGWTFPPAGVAASVEQLPADDATAIRLLNDLRAQGAGWFGVVRPHDGQLHQTLPGFAGYLASACPIAQQSAGWVIYRCLAGAR